jgi:aspartyl-tRNA(Asn)/glutamyl-tRNA(Gln) amidotransferase subunit B
MKEYYPVIGLEIHAELKTKSKMWCGCKNDPDNETPNANVCPVCMAHPGTLPVPNKEAIKKVVQVGLAIGADIANFSEFDRKNYFYPDIPKGYQISQYKYPIVSGGKLRGVDITRIHLEEDTAKSIHDRGDYTLIDFNRAGVPLMELVTEACIHSAEDAGNFARELQLILRTVGASDANMELGQMRVEVNLSVSTDPKVFGTKVEVKNLNSFKTVEKAIAYEIDRHIGLLESGESVVQETRGWDEDKQATFSQRKKENAKDYRYFPDPDLPKMYIHEMFNLEELKNALPELPQAKRLRYEALGLGAEARELIVSDIQMAEYFDALVAGKTNAFASLAANYLTTDITGLLKKQGVGFETARVPNQTVFTELLDLILANELSSRGAKDILPELMDSSKTFGAGLRTFVEEKGLLQKNDRGALEAIVDAAILENPTQWAEYKAGNDKLLMFFVGQCMKASKGSGNPGLFQEIIKSK